MAARLQRDISGGAFGQRTGLTQRVHFGVRAAGLKVKALPHNLAAARNHAAHARIGRSGKTPLPSEGEGVLHHADIKFAEHNLPVVRARGAIQSFQTA